jgi:hypothetical protein
MAFTLLPADAGLYRGKKELTGNVHQAQRDPAMQ